MTTLEIRQQKKQIREECKKIRKSIEKQHKEELDRKICDAIISSVSFHYADTLLLFYLLLFPKSHKNSATFREARHF